MAVVSYLLPGHVLYKKEKILLYTEWVLSFNVYL